MEEKLREVDSLPENREMTGSGDTPTPSSALVINNDHSLDDVKRDNLHAATSNALVKEKTKRRSKPLLVFLLALVMAVLGGIATLMVYKLYFEKPLEPLESPVSQSDIPLEGVDRLRAKDVLSDLTTVAQLTDTSDSEPTFIQAIKLAGTDFYTSVSTQHSAEKDVAATDSSVTTAVIAKDLKNKDFTETIVQTGVGQEVYIANYAHKDVICQVSAAKTYDNPAGKHHVVAKCQDMSAYEKAAKDLLPFYRLLPDTMKTSQSISLSGDIAGKTSKTAGYMTTTLGLNSVIDDYGSIGPGSIQLFYQTPDKKWHYFKGTQQLIPCIDYITTDLKKAYVGEKCYDTTTNIESVVAL
ncbi:MAG: hypothetical protein KA604_01260 [Candidatus Saccharimonas sp.]|nr:hypothetical protein [Candidatus Saccharimonas sp.]